MKKSKQNILSTPQVWRRLIGEGRWMAPSGVITAASDTGPCLGPCGNPHHSIHLRSDKTCNCNLYAAAAAGSSIGCQGQFAWLSKGSLGLAWTPCGGQQGSQWKDQTHELGRTRYGEQRGCLTGRSLSGGLEPFSVFSWFTYYL